MDKLLYGGVCLASIEKTLPNHYFLLYEPN
jgi:hypothetical protein